MIYTQFGKKARKAMIDRDMTMTSLAKELKISNSYLTDIFKGTRKGAKQKVRIAQILELQ